MANQKIKAMVAIVAFAVAGVLIGRSLQGDRLRPNMSKAKWFYDLQNGALLSTSGEPDRANGVRAFVYTCSSCDESNREVVFIEQYSDEARRTLARINELEDELQKAPLWETANRGRLVAAVPSAGEKPTWVAADSEQGKELTNAFWTMCDGEQRGTLCAAP